MTILGFTFEIAGPSNSPSFQDAFVIYIPQVSYLALRLFVKDSIVTG